MEFEGKEFKEVDQANWKEDSGIYLKFSDGNGNYRWFIEKKPEPLTNCQIDWIIGVIKKQWPHIAEDGIIRKLGALKK